MSDSYVFDTYSEHTRGDEVVTVARIGRTWLLLLRGAGKPLSEAQVAVESHDPSMTLRGLIPIACDSRRLVEGMARDWANGELQLTT